MNLVFNLYSKGANSYELGEMEHGLSKFFLQKHITLSGSRKRNKSDYLNTKVLETMTMKTLFKVEVSVVDTSISERSITKNIDYHFSCDKIWKEIVPCQRYYYMLALGIMH